MDYYCEFCKKCPNHKNLEKLQHGIGFKIQCCDCRDKFPKEFPYNFKNFWIMYSKEDDRFCIGVYSKKIYIFYKNNNFYLKQTNSDLNTYILTFKDSNLEQFIIELKNKIDNKKEFNTENIFEYVIKKYFDNAIFI